ncbi:MAG: cell division protein FtsQ/DivIB [Alphaproteobacteria bacterium]|nr:cell division protein FtsQ/DivIB [Alphaproteobacteria bacterium]
MSAFQSFVKTFGSARIRLLARTGSVVLLGGSIVHGILQGGMLDYEGSPLRNLSGKLASMAGMAAVDIRVSGLTHHDPELLFRALGVRPGASLIGFDTGEARRTLEAMNWVGAASVQRQYPNRLEISVAERVPFAIWQYEGAYSLVDKAGFTMGGLELMGQSHLPLVTGAGANLRAAEIINQLEANPLLFKRVSAAAMVGKRRWTLYLNNGVKVALPAEGVGEALAKLSKIDADTGLLSKAVSTVDMRIAGQMTVSVIEIANAKKDEPVGEKLVQKQ